MITLNTPIESIRVDGRDFYLKRDDLIDKDFSGNKARKLYYYLVNDFPNIKKLISYGSNQSNAMYSMSVLAKLKGWGFEYSIDHLPEYLSLNPHGNYAAALANGMKLKVNDKNIVKNEADTLYVSEGGRDKIAEFGLKLLAYELMDQSSIYNFRDIFLPSGTGATALFLQKSLINLGSLLQVFTTPCVGDSGYLLEQFRELESDERFYPIIIEPQKKWHFGKLYREHYEIWIKLQKDTNIKFDMLYDPIGWQVLLASELGDNTLYIHQGGLLGNESMRLRYERKFKDIN